MPPAGPGQDRVLALEPVRVGEPAARLHELQPHAACASPASSRSTCVDVAAQDRRQVRVDDRRVAARRRASSAGSPRATPTPARSRCARASAASALLVLRVAIAVHQHDRAPRGCRARTPRAASRSRRAASSGAHDLAVRADALVDLDHALVQQRRQLDPAHEQLRPILVADAQRVGEAARDHQQPCARPCARAARWSRPSCPSSPRRDRPRGIGAPRRETAAARGCLHGRVAVALRVLRQQLVRDAACRRAGARRCR